MIGIGHWIFKTIGEKTLEIHGFNRYKYS